MHKQASRSAPFVYAGNTSDSMYTVKNILLGALVLLGCYQFGVPALFNGLSVIAMVFCTDSLLHYFMKKRLFWEQSLQYGLLIAACIPPAVSLIFVAPVIVVVYLVVQWTAIHEHRPVCNPSLAVIVVLYAFFSFATHPGYIDPVFWRIDIQSAATPLSSAELAGTTTAPLSEFPFLIVRILEWIQNIPEQLSFTAIPEQTLIQFFGLTAGTIAEQFSMLILIASVFLFAYSYIRITPIVAAGLGFILCIYTFAGIEVENALFRGDILHHILNGGFLFALFFFAGDTSLSSKSIFGNCLFGLSFGIVAALFRVYGPRSDGTAFALLLSSMLVPLWDQCELTFKRYRHYVRGKKKLL